jgi:2-polyprenyl-3-methyl-5-hydroxy-6-metoxy-1,4-benzoquinol methylase
LNIQSLTRREHWDAVHDSEREAVAAPLQAAPGHWLRRTLKRLLGARFLEYMSSYDDHQIWDVLYRQHMPRPGALVLEVGSAPGTHLVKLHQTFGLDPYGIEYSESGVEVNRALFASHGLDPQHVVQLDFFSDECLQRYRGSFDVVVSRGFIEHFAEPARVVGRHLELLKPGGLLIVTIPNLRGVNRGLTWLFHRELLPMHNLAIMSKPGFSALFDTASVRPLVCAYVGTFSFYLFNVKPGSRLAPLLRGCMKLQTLLNVAFRALFGEHGAENRFTSPQLFFAGIKRGD